MNILDIIEKKKMANELSKDEIEYFVNTYTSGETTDYQAAALIMAICINGMTENETVALTIAMAKSGDILDLSEISNNIIDKHSTGGIGDKVTLIVAPIVASLGIPVAKMSGRGLGITGGTIDKLESIPGYKTNISIEEFKTNIKDIGISLIGASLNLAPADKKIYALRDTISCTNSIPLIASSIMSKKIAAGANSLVLDVTVGSGAFMQDEEEAEKLAKIMIAIGKLANLNTRCVLTNMNEPLGNAVGNTLEVIEAINALHGNMKDDVKEVIFTLACEMLLLSNKFNSKEEIKLKIQEVLDSGKAFNKFKELVAKQGGDISYIEDVSKFEKAPIITPVISNRSGYITKLDAYKIGKAGINLGIGRIHKEDSIDSRVGMAFEKKIGDFVNEGDILAYVHANDSKKAMECIDNVLDAYEIGNLKVIKNNILKIM